MADPHVDASAIDPIVRNLVDNEPDLTGFVGESDALLPGVIKDVDGICKKIEMKSFELYKRTCLIFHLTVRNAIVRGQVPHRHLSRPGVFLRGSAFQLLNSAPGLRFEEIPL